MNFTSDEKIGYKTMLECFDHYEAMEAVNETAMDVFHVDYEKFMD